MAQFLSEVLIKKVRLALLRLQRTSRDGDSPSLDEPPAEFSLHRNLLKIKAHGLIQDHAPQFFKMADQRTGASGAYLQITYRGIKLS